MKPPSISIRITRPEQFSFGGTVTPMSYQDIEIAGNKAGLLELAELICKVAESNDKGHHTHLWPDDEKSILFSKEFGLTITLNSVK